MIKHRVSLLFRSQRRKRYSIENLFGSLLPDNSQYHNVYIEHIKLHNPSISIIKMIRNILFYKNIKSEILHITGDVHYLACFKRSGKTILTIHDCINYYQIKNPVKKYIYKKLWFDIPINRVDLVTTISDESKRRLIKLTKCASSKITVIPNAVGNLIKLKPKTFNYKQPSILLLGTKLNKNLKNVLNSIRSLNCKLIIVGKLTKEQTILLAKTKFLYDNYFDVTNEKIYELYEECDIVSFISLDEGFGIPILEAQKLGRVVITSNIEPMKSIAGNGAYLVNPKSHKSILKGFEEIINNSKFRKQLILNGLNNVKKYSQVNIRSKYLKLYTDASIYL